jgi:hypothetical protein
VYIRKSEEAREEDLKKKEIFSKKVFV